MGQGLCKGLDLQYLTVAGHGSAERDTHDQKSWSDDRALLEVPLDDDMPSDIAAIDRHALDFGDHRQFLDRLRRGHHRVETIFGRDHVELRDLAGLGRRRFFGTIRDGSSAAIAGFKRALKSGQNANPCADAATASDSARPSQTVHVARVERFGIT